MQIYFLYKVTTTKLHLFAWENVQFLYKIQSCCGPELFLAHFEKFVADTCDKFQKIRDAFSCNSQTV
jgi:hypothetical protein